MIAVQSTHRHRTIVIWLERVYRGVKTGDLGRHELAPDSLASSARSFGLMGQPW
jgi:hypothetical protein